MGGRTCIAPLCKKHRIKKVKDKAKVRSFHRLPLKSPILLAQWMQNLADHANETWKANYLNLNKATCKPKNMSVCSLHFTEDCFDTSVPGFRLKPNAVPTLFGINAAAQRCSVNALGHDYFSIKHDHTYPLGDATSIKLKLNEMQDKLKIHQHGKNQWQTKYNRLQSELNETDRQLLMALRKVKQLEYLDRLLRTAQIGDTIPANGEECIK